MKPDTRFLLVEDDEVDAMTVKRALRDLKATNPLDHVTDGEAALAFLRDPGKPRPGLILLDLNMPRMNGIEFLAVAKEDPALKAIPVVVLTTSKAEADRMNSFGHSVAGYMIKPVDYPQFVEIMQTIRTYWMTSESPPA
jgi:CheY-like chemotaxis protein